MTIRFALALWMALFFAGFVPAALACTLSSERVSPRMAEPCGHPVRMVLCTSTDALSAVQLPKAGENCTPAVPVPSPSPALVGNPYRVVAEQPVAAVPPFRQHATLFMQAILLRI